MARGRSAMNGASTKASPWLFDARKDLCAFAFLPLISLAVAFAFPTHETSPLAFLVLVIGCDVAHVWSTVFRISARREIRERYGPRLLQIAAIAFAFGVALVEIDVFMFWRVLAYVAVFHFVRQQLGFLRLYLAREKSLPGRRDRWEKKLAQLAIVCACLYPLLYWHTHARTFAWFVPGDFFAYEAAGPWVAKLLPVSIVLLAASLVTTFVVHAQNPPWGRIFLLITTWLSWHIGIVFLNGDLAFTATNVVLHGVPYLLLTHRTFVRTAHFDELPPGASRFTSFLPFLLTVVALAFVEEALWDRTIWHDHEQLFGRGNTVSGQWVRLLTVVLALPQIAHYILDGMIWKRAANPELRELFA